MRRSFPAFVRFGYWNLLVRLCDTGVGTMIDEAALRYERRTGRESRVYGCVIHDWLNPGADVPDRWWSLFGWHVPGAPWLGPEQVKKLAWPIRDPERYEWPSAFEWPGEGWPW